MLLYSAAMLDLVGSSPDVEPPELRWPTVIHLWYYWLDRFNSLNLMHPRWQWLTLWSFWCLQHLHCMFFWSFAITPGWQQHILVLSFRCSLVKTVERHHLIFINVWNVWNIAHDTIVGVVVGVAVVVVVVVDASPKQYQVSIFSFSLVNHVE